MGMQIFHGCPFQFLRGHDPTDSPFITLGPSQECCQVEKAGGFSPMEVESSSTLRVTDIHLPN